MTILVVSDSHGTVSDVCDLVERIKPDRMIFLGDGWEDIEHVVFAFPKLPIDRVPGNCDYVYGEDWEKLVILNGKRIFLCHGHTRRVKQGTAALEEKAQLLGADIALYGHTHIPDCRHTGRMWLMNPGSMSRYANQSYGIIEITDGKLNCSVYRYDDLFDDEDDDL